MHEYVGVLIFIAVWLVISRWVFPRFGVST